ncbi:MAG: phenylalanine--tRNA ligase subunit beta [Bacillota bacterium]
MRVPYNWLLDYIKPEISADELANLLTLSGIEVGAVERFGSSLPGVVVGEVEALKPHPGRDNLILVDTRVEEEVLKIVCGAKNMQVSDKVPVAKPGSVLPGERHIEEAVIYGATSTGMICSARELGLELGAEDEILILDQTAEIGTPVDQVLGFDDKILELELTPNRPDCLSMLGVAHEAAALTGAEVKLPELEPPETTPALEEFFKVQVDDPDLCPRYTARAVKDVVIKKSPLWMQLRLLKAGIRPISNVVDITNYVMWEFGQPLHAFDLQRLESSEILVRRAREGETLVTLDGIERKLTPEILVITDGNMPIALAGVMGGEDTEIFGKTREVLIEAAGFNPTNIRRTARRYNLPSEASQRFERGVNPEAAVWSQNRAALLMNKYAEGKVLRGIIDYDANPVKPATVKVSSERVNKILGTEVPENEIITILNRLGFEVYNQGGGNMEVVAPLRRGDIFIEEDVVEEIARLYGYNQIPYTLPRGELLENRPTEEERLHNLVKNVFTASGFFEGVTYSFINPSDLVRLRYPSDHPHMQTIPVQNPFSEEQGVMRTTLLPGLLKAVRHNISHRELNQMLFEIGSVFKADSLPLKELPQEKAKLAVAATGVIPEQNWAVTPRKADFFTIKGTLETLFSRLQINAVNFIPVQMPFSHPTRCAKVMIGDVELGYLGQLHPDIAEAWEIDQPVTVGEFDLSVLENMANLVPRVTPLPRYPASSRDLAIVVPKEISAKQLEKTIREAGGDMVSRVKLFDLYEGKQIPEDKRSLAYSITFRLEDRTLTDQEVNQAQQNIEKALFELGAVLRS